MVLIDFDRPGLDSTWGAAHKYSDMFVTCDDKYSDGFPMESATKRFRGESHSSGSAASSSNMQAPMVEFAAASIAAPQAEAIPASMPEASQAEQAYLALVIGYALGKECGLEAEASPSIPASPQAQPVALDEDLAIDNKIDLELKSGKDIELKTFLADQGIPADLEPKTDLDLNLQKDLAIENELGLDLMPEKDIEVTTAEADQGLPTDDTATQDFVIASEQVPTVEDWEPNGKESAEQKKDSEEKSTAIEAKPTVIAQSTCWSFFSALLKPAPPAKKLDRQQVLDAADDPELERALRESASVTEAKELSVAVARVRLQNIMDQYKAKPRPVQADGNCQFRALAFGLHGDEDRHGEVRAQMVQWLYRMKERYSDFVYEPYDDYLKRMASHGEWGDNVSLQAVSDMLHRDIHVLNDQPGAQRISIHPADEADSVTEKPLWLAFLAEVHYDAVEFL